MSAPHIPTAPVFSLHILWSGRSSRSLVRTGWVSPCPHRAVSNPAIRETVNRRNICLEDL